MARLREKSIALTGFLQRLIEDRLPRAVEIITPGEPSERGCQLSLRLALPGPEARRCHERLIAAGVIGDWREPDILRLAPAPLYNSYQRRLRARSRRWRARSARDIPGRFRFHRRRGTDRRAARDSARSAAASR